MTSTVVQRLRAGTGTPFSLEFMPPRDAAGESRLWRTVRAFEAIDPAFVSITYGAGGSTRDATARVVGEIAERTALLPVAHLTAVAHSVAELCAMVDGHARRGVRNLLVLRGDPPGDPLGPWTKHPDGIEYAEQLVRLVAARGDFHIGVAAFPEGHHAAPDLARDTATLVAKLRAGADYAITQMFFDPDCYLRLRDRLTAVDPEQAAKPIIPGIMPILSLASLRRMAQLCDATLPPAMVADLERAAGSGPEEDRDAVRAAGVDIATRLCEKLIAEGVPALHFCTLNRSRATREILANLGLR
ncbi:methylenetetrahydrofolate reductase [Nocardia sp. CC227C]|uniref:methylenetetrahydrofolate reductase n=1 Tax=Nocardia sp. CC227C TaxID=3044562 RepID=UPI00278BE79B|nr:methylenetetrahydrofolate reductase [Nocardia sp. CC227C]